MRRLASRLDVRHGRRRHPSWPPITRGVSPAVYAVDNLRDRSWAQAPFLECGAALAAVGLLQGVKIRVKVENAQLRRAIPLYVQSKELRMIRPTLAYAVLAFSTTFATGQTSTPGIDGRQANQEQRVHRA